MVLDVKIDQVIAEKIEVKHQSVFFETPGSYLVDDLLVALHVHDQCFIGKFLVTELNTRQTP